MMHFLEDMKMVESTLILAVSHKVSIACLLAELEGWPDDLRTFEGFPRVSAGIDNVSVTSLILKDGHWQLEFIGKNPADLESLN